MLNLVLQARPATFRALLGGVAAAGVLSLLYLNTQLEQTAFTEHDLSQQMSTLDGDQQILSESLAALSSPDRLVVLATTRGLVPETEVRFVTPAGKLVGAPLPKGYSLPARITADPGTVLALTPAPKTKAKAKASAGPSPAPSQSPAAASGDRRPASGAPSPTPSTTPTATGAAR